MDVEERLESARPDETPAIVWLGFMAMCVGMFMAILDVQVVATSLPTIQSALDMVMVSIDTFDWSS
ncbi:hypothetical protein AB9E03_33835, partial [Rhizobium leguminosarum]